MLEMLEQPKAKPPRILIYGPEKIGKSTFGAMAEKPIFIQTEDGLDGIFSKFDDAKAFKKAASFDDVMTQIGALAENEHDRKTLVIDSLDWLEPLIWKAVSEENNVDSIEKIGYGKGYVMALELWKQLFEGLNYLRDERGMMVIMVAHAHVKKFDNPDTEGYDRYEIKLHKSAAAKVSEYSDVILFANYRVIVKKEAERLGQKDEDKRRRAVGSGERVLHSEERPAFIAGNRYGLPAEIRFDDQGDYWGVIAAHIPFFKSGN